MAVKYKHTEMQIFGVKELEHFLVKELPATVSRRVTLNAMRAAAQPMKAAVKAHSLKSKRSGALWQSINLKTVPARLSARKGSYASMTLSPMSNLSAWARYMSYYKKTAKSLDSIGRIRHGHLVEFGFRHWKTGQMIPAQPFMRPALDQTASGYIQDFKQRLATRVKNAVKKHRSARGVK